MTATKQNLGQPWVDDVDRVLAKKAFFELWERKDFVELRGLLSGGRDEAVAQRMAWKAYQKAINGNRDN